MPNESPNLDNIFDNLEESNSEENKNSAVNTPDSSSHALSTEKILSKSAPESNNLDILTELDKLELLKMWENDPENPPSIESLCEKIRPKKMLDGRSKIGREIKKYISSLNLPAPKTKTNYEKKPDIILTDEQKEYIRNNPNEKITDIASALFGGSFYYGLSQECQSILKYQKELEQSGGYKKTVEDDEEGEEYRPPKTFDHVCARINKHVEGANYEAKKLTPTQKKQCINLISYMKSYRFSHHYNLINTKEDRYLFENTFLKYIYNKTDLSQEDLDQYLALANEAVAESSIKRNILRLEREQERSLDETGKLQMNLVDAMKVSRDEYNACRGRQDKLYKALELERSKRLNERVGPQFTLLNIVEEFRNEQRRLEWLEAAEERNKRIGKEIDRLSKFDEGIVRIYGIDKDLVLNG